MMVLVVIIVSQYMSVQGVADTDEMIVESN
jgi:hypothetical protein